MEDPAPDDMEDEKILEDPSPDDMAKIMLFL